VSSSPVAGSGVAVEPVEARLVSRYGWVIGIVVCQASPHARLALVVRHLVGDRPPRLTPSRAWPRRASDPAGR